MIKKFGVCENLGNCKTADNKTPIEITKENDGLCPECGEDLEGNKPIKWKQFAALAVLLLLLLSATPFLWGWLKNNDTKVIPVPDPTPAVVNTNTNKSPEIQTYNTWTNGVLKRGFIIMGVQADADPMNYTGKSVDDEKGYKLSAAAWEEAKKHGEKGEADRYLAELDFPRVGFDYEFMQLLANQMRLESKVKAREVEEFKELFSLINRKESDDAYSVDLIMSGIAKDDTYKDSIDWSDSYLDLYYSLVTEKNSKIKTIEDCKSKKIGIVQSDNVVKRFVENEMPGAIVVPLSDATDDWMVKALKTKTVDAVIQDYPFAVSETAEEPNLEIRIASMKSKDPQYDPKYVIGVRKGDKELLGQINAAISKIKDSPAYINLLRSYLESEKITAPDIEDGTKTYKIRRGDTLSEIARDELGDASRYEEILELNPSIPGKYLIFENDLLIMPNDYEKKKVRNIQNRETKMSANSKIEEE